MGVLFSLLGSLGLPSVDSMVTDKVFDRFTDVTDFDKFHEKIIELFTQLNEIMPGKHYIIKETAREEIVKLYDKWTAAKQDEEKKKRLLLDFMTRKVEVYKPSSTLMITTGCVAPGAAILLKRSGEKVPQLKKLRIDLVPDFVFVPGVTLLSVIGVRMFGLSKATSSLSKNAQAASSLSKKPQ